MKVIYSIAPILGSASAQQQLLHMWEASSTPFMRHWQHLFTNKRKHTHTHTRHTQNHGTSRNWPCSRRPARTYSQSNPRACLRGSQKPPTSTKPSLPIFHHPHHPSLPPYTTINNPPSRRFILLYFTHIYLSSFIRSTHRPEKSIHQCLCILLASRNQQTPPPPLSN